MCLPTCPSPGSFPRVCPPTRTMRRRTTSLLSKRYPKRRTTLKRPSDFLLRDTHDDVLEADEFKQLWWRIKENLNEGLGVQGAGMPATAVTKTAMAIVQNCAAHRVLHVKQLCSIIKLFDTDSGRLEVLEFFVLRAHKLSFKGDIIPLFQLPLRPYVSDILESAMLVEPTEGIPQGAMLFRNKLRKSRSIVHAMLSALERIHFNRSNQNNVINAILSRNCLPLSHRQAFRILGNFVDDIPTLLNVIDLIDRHVIGFTCREISLLLNRIAGVRDRVTVLTKVASMILDSEHRWIALDAGFGDDVDTEIREDVAHFLHNLSVLPRSFVFGTVTARTVCFVVDTTSSMSATFITNQGERITRLRFVMRELTRVLRHQLSESTRFNIVAFSAEATAWSASGAVEASKMNVRMACDWLRDLKAVGPTHVFEALSLAFESCGEGLEAVYVVTDGDPSRGMDTEMDKICNAPRLDLTQFTKAPRVHVSGIVLGNHDFDNAAQTETWVRDLATWGGGIARFLVDDTYDNTASSGSVRSSSLRPPVKHGTGAVWQVANLCSFVLLCLLIWVTQFSGLRGTGGIATRRTYADMNSLFPTFLLPLDALFRAWYILLVFMGLNVLYMCRWPLCCYNQNQRRRQKNSVAKMSSKGVQLFVLRCQLGMTNWKLPAWHLITCVWIIANQAEVMVVALVCAFLDLILLVSLHQSLRIGKHPMKYDVLQDMRLSQKERDTVGSATNSSVEGGSGSGGVGGDADEGSGANRDDDDDAPTDRPSLFNRPNGVLWSERLFMGIPISAGLSLVSFLVCIQFGQYLQTWEWFGWGWQEEWALVLICLLFSVGFLFAVVLDDAVFGAVTAITHFGVALNNFSESRSIGDLSKVASVSDFSYGFMIYVGTMTSAITLTVLALKPIAKGYAELLYKTLFKKLRSADTKVHEQAEVKSLAHKAQTITWRQTFVFSMWFLTVVVSLLADESVNKIMLSLETPFINHMTFLGVTRLTDFPAGDVGQFVGAIRAMPSTFFFGVFFVVYGLLLMYVLLQALPLEQLGRNVDYLREEDMALEKHVFVRGTRQRWSKRKLCCGCRRLPLVHKWRLTPRASDLLIGNSGTFFLFSCLLNILFVVCYLHKQYLAALICFLLLFFTVIAWYLKVKAWHISPDPKSKEEIARLKQEFEQAHANEPAEIMAEKWDAVERRKTKIPRHVSSVETFVLHVPISAYLGLLAFMVVFISSQFTVLYVGVGPGGGRCSSRSNRGDCISGQHRHQRDLNLGHFCGGKRNNRWGHGSGNGNGNSGGDDRGNQTCSIQKCCEQYCGRIWMEHGRLV